MRWKSVQSLQYQPTSRSIQILEVKAATELLEVLNAKSYFDKSTKVFDQQIILEE